MIYTAQEVAKILRVSVETVRKLIKSGQLKSFKVGHQDRITHEDLMAYMNRDK
jgi:excisionase family DNA binding protein